MKAQLTKKSPTRRTIEQTAETGRKQPSLHVRQTRLTQSNGASMPTFEQIQEQAYFIYLNEGRPEGRALNHWVKAEAKLGVRAPVPPPL